MANDAELDENGNWISNETTDETTFECRLDARSVSDARIGDGEQAVVTATIYTPPMAKIDEGTQIRVTNQDDVIFEGVVKTHNPFRLHTTINAQGCI